MKILEGPPGNDDEKFTDRTINLAPRDIYRYKNHGFLREKKLGKKIVKKKIGE